MNDILQPSRPIASKKPESPTDPKVSGQPFDPRPKISISTLSGQAGAFTLGRLVERFLWLHWRWLLFKFMTPFDGVYPLPPRSVGTERVGVNKLSVSNHQNLKGVFGVRANLGATRCDSKDVGFSYGSSSFRNYQVPENCFPSDEQSNHAKEALLPIYQCLRDISSDIQEQRATIASRISEVVRMLAGGDQLSNKQDIERWMQSTLDWPNGEREAEDHDDLLDANVEFDKGLDDLSRQWWKSAVVVQQILESVFLDRDSKSHFTLGRHIEGGVCPNDQPRDSTRWRQVSGTITSQCFRKCQDLMDEVKDSDLEDYESPRTAADIIHFLCFQVLDLCSNLRNADPADQVPSKKWLTDLQSMLETRGLDSGTADNLILLKNSLSVSGSRSDFVKCLSGLTHTIEHQLCGTEDSEELPMRRLTLAGPFGLVYDSQTGQLRRTSLNRDVKAVYVCQAELVRILTQLMQSECFLRSKDNAIQQSISRLRKPLKELGLTIKLTGDSYHLRELETVADNR